MIPTVKLLLLSLLSTVTLSYNIHNPAWRCVAEASLEIESTHYSSLEDDLDANHRPTNTFYSVNLTASRRFKHFIVHIWEFWFKLIVYIYYQSS